MLNYDVEPSRPDPVEAMAAKHEPSNRSDDTKARLREAAFATVRDVGLAGASARAIASAAQVNQALIFYHFHTVAELLEAASDAAIDESLQHYRAAFDRVTSVDELVEVSRQLHAREQAIGNVAFMAQMLSGAQHDPVLARAARSALGAWTGEVQAVLQRVLRGSPADGLLDIDGLARLVAAGFVGLELYGAADPEGAESAMATLERIGRLVDTVNELGPLVGRALGAAAKRRR